MPEPIKPTKDPKDTKEKVKKPTVTKKKRTPIDKFPLAATKRVFEGSGADQVSQNAVKYMNDHLFDLGKEVAKKAAKIAIHGGRKTVKADDIKLALEG